MFSLKNKDIKSRDFQKEIHENKPSKKMRIKKGTNISKYFEISNKQIKEIFEEQNYYPIIYLKSRY